MILIGALCDSAIRHASRRRAVRSDRDRVVLRRSRRSASCWIVRSAGGLARIRSAPCRARSSQTNGFMGFAVLGAVFLAVTGGEALYADMGHFGRKPIRLAWFCLVLPCAGPELSRPGRAAAGRIPAPSIRSSSWRRRGRCCRWSRSPPRRRSSRRRRSSPARSRSRGRRCSSVSARASTSSTPRRSEMGQVYVPRVNWALMVATVADRDRLPIIGRDRGGIRHRRDADDDHHRAAALHRDDGAVALAEAGRGAGDGRVPDDRPGVLRRQRVEDHAGWLAAAGRGDRPVHADDDVAHRTADRRRAPGRPRRSADGFLHARRLHEAGCACRAPRST